MERRRLKADNSFWSRAIIHIDMDAFFAAVEQRDNPQWRARPIVITNGQQGSCIITSSYEARRCGIKTGMHLFEARRLCPDLLQVASRPEVYVQCSQQIMHLLRDFTPKVEVFSIDEAFLDITAVQRLWRGPERCAQLIQQKIFVETGLTCSLGVSADKTTAKYASKLKKPSGLTIIPPQDAAKWLAPLPVTALCGIAKGISSFLSQHGAHTCAAVARLPVSVLSKRFGNLGRRLWLMCQAQDPSQVTDFIAPAKTMGHGKVLPPQTIDLQKILLIQQSLCVRLCARLRKNHVVASKYWVGVRTRNWGWLGDIIYLPSPMAEDASLLQAARKVIYNCQPLGVVVQLQITALNLSTGKQTDWQADVKLDNSGALQDDINTRFGSGRLQPARLLQLEKQSKVISPSWRDSGERQSID